MTPYSDIFELFLISIKDYQIDKLYNSSVATAEEYMTPFLIKSIPKFINCQKDLEDRDDSARTFNITLNTDEKVILSDLMLVEWLTKEVNDILQMKNYFQGNDFKRHSEANNLNAKSELLTKAKESVSQNLTDYSYKNIDWSTLG